MKRPSRMKSNKNQLSELGTPTDWWRLHRLSKTGLHSGFTKVALGFTNSTGWIAKQVDGSTFILIVTSLCIKFSTSPYIRVGRTDRLMTITLSEENSCTRVHKSCTRFISSTGWMAKQVDFYIVTSPCIKFHRPCYQIYWLTDFQCQWLRCWMKPIK